MPSALVAGLSAPLRQIQAMLGTGPAEAPTAALSAIRDALADVSIAAGGSWERTGWVGRGADAADEFTRSTVAAVEALAERTAGLDTAATGAADAIARARERLRAIVADFEARAAALEGRLDEPGTADELAAEARRALDEANAVLDDLRAELGTHQAAVSQHTTGSEPAATMPSGAMPSGAMPSVSMPGLGGGSGSAMPSGMGSGMSSGQGAFDPAGFSAMADQRPDAPPLADPGMFGSGVAVQLPDGSTANAPNAVAASAVRHALTQLGVPYDWGGTTPGVGLDCSGLTQWAYHEAGLDIPRLAQEQDIGSAVGQASLRPGDLAVWDGHVAMIAGSGMMVEAGDPVKLSPIRTTNAGQGFQGFWRPTA